MKQIQKRKGFTDKGKRIPVRKPQGDNGHTCTCSKCLSAIVFGKQAPHN